MRMKRLLMVSLLAALAFAAVAETDGASAAQSATAEKDDARRERYRRRHEMLMERAMKRGHVVPVVPVAPVPPPSASVSPPPVVAVAPVSLYGAGTDPASMQYGVSVKVQSLTYDENEGRGVLTVEVVGGSFTGVNRYIRANIGKFARNDTSGDAAPKIPPDAWLKVESITINESDFCEVRFAAKEKTK